MDSNRSSFGKSNEQIMIWSLSSSEDQWSCTSSVRSYTCTFCKKGFSNAQALGGHMNIHRKDRAKLRESLDEHLLSLETTKSINPPDDHQKVSQDKSLFPLDSIEEGSSFPKSPYSLSLEDDVSSSTNKDFLSSCSAKISSLLEGDDEASKLQLNQRPNRMEPDLELRLGPEPPEISSTSNTREFF